MLKPRSGIELRKNIGLHYCIEGDVGGCHDFGFVVHAERGGARRHFDGGADHGEAGGQQLEQQRGGRREHLRGESVSNAVIRRVRRLMIVMRRAIDLHRTPEDISTI